MKTKGLLILLFLSFLGHTDLFLSLYERSITELPKFRKGIESEKELAVCETTN